MTHLLPPNLLRLFAPRPPIPFLKPIARDIGIPLQKKLDGVAGILEELREEAALREAEEEEKRDAEAKAAKAGQMQVDGATKAKLEAKKESARVNGDNKPSVKREDAEMEEGESNEEPVKATAVPSGEAVVKAEEGKLVDDSGQTFTYTEGEKQRQRRLMFKQKREEDFKTATETYKPEEDPEAVGDPYKTLFISRLSYQVTEEDLRREFAMYGPIERIVVIREKTGKRKGKSRGYAFILYEREKDMKEAYKDANNLKILGRRILVDVERGRTVKGWKPRRLGGGLGGRAKPPPPVEFAAPAFSGNSFGGGGRGGFGGSSRGRGGGGGGGGGFRGGGRSFGGPPGGDRGGGAGPRGGGIGFQGGFRPENNRDSRGGGFNQGDLIGQQGGGWGQRSKGPSGGDNGNFPPRGASAYGGASANNFEVPRQPMQGVPPPSSSSYGSRGGGGGYGDYPPEKRSRY